MKTLRKIIKIDEELCDGCGQCVSGCAEGSLQIVDGKAKMVSDNLCDGLGACIGECPTGALRIVERKSEEFDEKAVKKYLAEKEEAKQKQQPVLACGCPSTNIQTFAQASSCLEANIPANFEDGESALSHWPIQIRLVPATAPFLKGAALLVLADCCGITVPALHRDLLKGRVVMIGCPKFDDIQEYVEKFADIFKIADIKSVLSVFMEVPCCSGLPMIVKKGMDVAGKNIPIKEVVVSTRGKILEQK
ncbi:MAG: 4Fe-4S ferredoxin [Desulfobacteraceae bacterium]|nr:4Fe-4S ferredoxin [Pseudomonadota bacterium]MBU4462950.1 4Fe-4S ferredoxin [Pseudomonadota bacterium]MCG2754526.1 4Fe-4S ferredoxin [Desulfobacteraceae bacterium]